MVSPTSSCGFASVCVPILPNLSARLHRQNGEDGLMMLLIKTWTVILADSTKSSNVGSPNQAGAKMMSCTRRELVRLRRENQQLRMERKILLRTAVWFAREIGLGENLLQQRLEVVQAANRLRSGLPEQGHRLARVAEQNGPPDRPASFVLAARLQLPRVGALAPAIAQTGRHLHLPRCPERPCRKLASRNGLST